jgi:hypothetical protein
MLGAELHRFIEGDGIAKFGAHGMHHAFRASGGTGGEKDEQRVVITDIRERDDGGICRALIEGPGFIDIFGMEARFLSEATRSCFRVLSFSVACKTSERVQREKSSSLAPLCWRM